MKQVIKRKPISARAMKGKTVERAWMGYLKRGEYELVIEFTDGTEFVHIINFPVM